MEKLAADISAIEQDRLRDRTDTLTPAEAQFLVLADSRGKEVYRNGWPDFLVEDRESGGMIGVEVKCNSDQVSEHQAAMFAALERSGALRVYIWDPKKPATLTPWERYVNRPRRRGRDQRSGLLKARAVPRKR